MSNFDIKREKELIASGTHFWCSGHLGAVEVGERSSDSRYCKFCYGFLNNEVKILKETGHFRKGAAWIPKPSSKPVEGQAENKTQEAENISPGGMAQAINVSTVNVRKNTVDIIPPSPAKRTVGKRGPKKHDLPEKMIRQLADEGMGSKAIATKLRSQGIEVSYKTIQRLLSGQRVLVV